MWIFTSDGFISAVQHRDHPQVLIVRARRREHLEAVLPGFSIEQTDNADYRYRTQIEKHSFAHRLAEITLDINYDNFKNSIPDDQYHDACSGVWSVMHRLQPGSWRQGVTLAHEYAPDFDDLDQPELWPQDRESYSDDQDRESYSEDTPPALGRCAACGIETETPIIAGSIFYCSDCVQDGDIEIPAKLA